MTEQAAAAEAKTSTQLVWRQLHWPRPLDPERVTALLRQWATDQRSPRLVLELRATTAGSYYLLGLSASAEVHLARTIRHLIPGAELTVFEGQRPPVQAAGRFAASTRHRGLRATDQVPVVRALLTALTHCRDDEQLVVQILPGPSRIPLAIPTHSPSSIIMPWYQVAWTGNGGQVDSEKRSALRDKVSDHGFACTIRVGVSAGSRVRRRSLLLGVLAAARTSEAAGIKLKLVAERPGRVNRASAPWRWPLRLNVQELTALTGWPVGDVDLPGLPALHPRQVAPQQLAGKGDRVVAAAWAPGVHGQLGYAVNDALRHSWVLGPTGTGKSTLLLNLITADLKAGRPVVVIEPNDLVTDLLTRIPDNRRDDIVLLDSTDVAPVGVNPLQRRGRSPELVADSLLGTFRALYGDGLGPRSGDILSNALSVLARRDDASLVMLPLLLTNDGFRRSLTATAIRDDPIAAGPFWSWYENLSPDARSQIIAPLMNKLRPLLRPQLRAVLGQRRPRFNLRQVLTDHKVLLVPLQPGVVGPDMAELLGALVISELWLAIRERRAIPEAERTPVMIYVDEVQNYLRLPTDLSDALATSRSLKVGWHLAHQYRDQLSPSMRSAFEANARSRIAFQLSATDARAMAAGQTVLSAEDFSSLPAFHIYAALMRGNALQPWASGKTAPPPARCSNPDDIRDRSRAAFGQPLTEIEADFAALIANPTGPADETGQPTGRRARRPS